jgi:uracil-DNA glycosylase
VAEGVLTRLDVRERILDCEACELSGQNPPVPFYGPSPAFIGVLGEGPGSEETKQGRPFVGPAGRLARRTLDELGLDPEAMTWFNVTCCWPGVATNPSAEHVAACRPNLDLQFDLLAPTWLLVFGQSALSGIRPDLSIRRGRGRPFWHRGAVAYAVYHPSAVLRNGVMEHPFREDLERFVDLVDGGASDWWQAISDRCLECVDFVDHYDETGVGRCARHWRSLEAVPVKKKPAPAGPDIVETQMLFKPNDRARVTRM